MNKYKVLKEFVIGEENHNVVGLELCLEPEAAEPFVADGSLELLEENVATVANPLPSPSPSEENDEADQPVEEPKTATDAVPGIDTIDKEK